MTNLKSVLRYASIAAVLLAGSCAAPINDGEGLMSDGAVNHPIAVAPHYNALKLPFSAPEAGLMPDDAERLSQFVADYLEHGNGALSVSAPAGADASAALGYFGERLTAMGVPRARILVGTHDATDGRVEIGYIGYTAHTDPCGDWSKNLGDTSANRTAADFGCAVQQNIAAQIADPRDLVEPRTADSADATRRSGVLDNYEKGKVTSAEKTSDQTAKVSDVGGQ